jgi:ABC-type glutathione transport system ATPase component
MSEINGHTTSTNGTTNGTAHGTANGTGVATEGIEPTLGLSKPGGAGLLEVEGLKKYFPIYKGLFRSTIGHVRAVDGVSFSIRERETLALVGESGCGKTTTGRCVVRAVEPTSGTVRFKAQDGQWIDLLAQKGDDLRRLRREIQMIFQDPYSSLDPRMTLLQIVGEPLAAFGVKGRELEERVAQLLTWEATVPRSAAPSGRRRRAS